MPVVVGDSVPTLHIRVVQGDVFVLNVARSDADDVIIDTADYDARAMIRRKGGSRTLICDMVVGGGDGKGEIVLGIQGEEGEQQTNLSIRIPADVTATFPRVTSERRAEWEWDLEVISDPDDPDETTTKWLRGDVYAVNEVTHA